MLFEIVLCRVTFDYCLSVKRPRKIFESVHQTPSLLVLMAAKLVSSYSGRVGESMSTHMLLVAICGKAAATKQF